MIVQEIKRAKDFLVGESEEAEALREQLAEWMGHMHRPGGCAFEKFFEASQNTSDAAKKLYAACGNKAPCVILAKLDTGHIVGGFTSRSLQPNAACSLQHVTATSNTCRNCGNYCSSTGGGGTCHQCGCSRTYHGQAAPPATAISKTDSLAFIFCFSVASGRSEPVVLRPSLPGAESACLLLDSNCIELPTFRNASGVDLAIQWVANSSSWTFARSGSYAFKEARDGTFPAAGTVVKHFEAYRVCVDSDGIDASMQALAMGPWRTLNFSECVKEDQLEKLIRRTPKFGAELGVDHYNVLLFAGVGAGKSSFSNTLDSALLGRISVLANVGRGTASVTVPLTKRFLEDTNVCIWDTMGWTPETYMKDEFEYIVSGHVPDGFDLRRPMTLTTEGLERSPTLADRVHVVVFVVPAESLTSEAYLARLRAFMEVTRKPAIDVRAIVLLTKVDALDRALAADVGAVFGSARVHRARDLLAGPQGVGVHPTLVLPVKSYAFETETCPAVDVLALDALGRMLDAADDFLRDKRRQAGGDKRPASAAAGGGGGKQASAGKPAAKH